jgi:chaperonin GroES
MATKTKTKLNLRPLGDRLIIRRALAEEKTAGGIILPGSAQDKPKEGVVVAAGTGRILEDGKTAPMNVAVGNNVLFSSYAGTEVKVSGEDYLIMNESDILAIIV